MLTVIYIIYGGGILFKSFKGGIHLPEHKEETCRVPVRKLDGAPIHIFPLQQHIGAKCDPTVKVGDYVTMGQVIADSEAFLSVPIHSSISGTVIDIKPHVHPSGAEILSIFVENDFQDKVCKNVVPIKLEGMTKHDIIHTIRMGGVVGMGGAGFPTHIKLSPPEDKPITHLILNAAECEPYLTSDHRRLLEQGDEVVSGLKICMKLLGIEKGYIGIEANKMDAAKKLSEMTEASVEIVPLKTKYPQGGEKQLIRAITGKKVPMGGLPADVGVIVINVDTAYEISKLFKTGMPVTTRIVTVSGDAIESPCNLEVKLGTPFEFVIRGAGGFKCTPKKVIMGGPMMGSAVYSLDAPTIKTTSAILALSETADVYDQDSPCIKCGKCVKACPMQLMPMYLGKYASDGNLEMCEKYKIMNCIECGICSYLCPGRRNPLQNIRIAKQKINEQRRKK